MRIILSTFLIFSVLLSFGQLGSIKGRVLDGDENNEAVIGAMVTVLKDGVVKTGAATDVSGHFTINALLPGLYSVQIKYQGKEKEVQGIQVLPDEQNVLSDIVLTLEITTKVVQVTAKTIDPNRPTDPPISEAQIQNSAGNSVTSQIVTLTPGLIQKDGAIHSMGARGSGTTIFVDGIKGGAGVTKDAVEQAQVLSSGLSARYGDVTGSVINITTKGVNRTPNVQLRAVSSQVTDPYGYNFFSGVASTPLLWKKNAEGEKYRPIVGLRLFGEANFIKSGSSAIPLYQLRDGLLDSIEQNPLTLSPVTNTLQYTSQYVKKKDIVERNTFIDNNSYSLDLSPRFDFSLSDDIDLTIGGFFSANNGRGWSQNNSLFNYGRNSESLGNSIQSYVRFTQRLDLQGGDDQSQKVSFLTGAYYTIQADYTNSSNKSYDPTHKLNTFNYGHIGKFDGERTNAYQLGIDSSTQQFGWIHVGFRDTFVNFTSGKENPILARYTQTYYDLIDDRPNNFSSIQIGNGLINGALPGSVYSLFLNPGHVTSGYSKSNSQQFRLTLNANVDLNFKNRNYSEEAKKEAFKNDQAYNVEQYITHKLQFGFEYQQNVSSGYGVAPATLWTQMRSLANRHIQQLDTDNPTVTLGESLDTFTYNRLIVPSDQSRFDKNLRALLGYGPRDYINVDALDPSVFSLSMFSPDELLNNTNRFVNAYGYDYLGNLLTKQPSFNDFFTAKDANGDYARQMGAFSPIYAAAYIEDVFRVQDLFFRFGVRFDRFDVNSKVMKDQYSLYPIYNAGEVTNLGTHPGNVEDNWKVYVDDMENPGKIVGYRNGKDWYDENGLSVNDPNIIARRSNTGTITPYLVDPNSDIKDPNYDPNNSFTDYQPQIKVSPRISFRFKLTEQALFFAHYDILTQRPDGGNFATPYQYYFFEQFKGSSLNNPALQMQQTIDYEVGFTQRLGNLSTLALSAYYREFRDMIHLRPVLFAYPNEYFTYDNLDFGTTKGFKIRYDMGRERGAAGLLFSANYTYQVAEGTGSSANSLTGLLTTDNPNLRFIIPLDFDQRHSLGANIDYRFRDLPKIKAFKQTGFNLGFNMGSGFPYNATNEPIRSAQFGVQQRSTLKGSLNGSRLPWTSTLDLNVDKDIALSYREVEGMTRKIIKSKLNIYVAVLNILNTKNISGVFSYTGTPDDDGFLSSAVGEEFTSNQLDPQSFYDLYRIKLANPGRYGSPRRIRVGAILNF